MKCSPEDPLGVLVPALGLAQEPQLVEALRNLGMILSQQLAAQLQGFLQQWRCLFEQREFAKGRSHGGQQSGADRGLRCEFALQPIGPAIEDSP